MKRLFQLAVLAGAAYCVYLVIVRSRRTAAEPDAPAWSPPVVEREPAAPPAEDLAAAETEGMTEPLDAVPVDVARGSGGAIVVSELAAPGAEPEAEMEMPAEAPLAVASDDGMTAPADEPPEDVAVSSEGDVLISELAAPGAEAELTEADEALETALDVAADDGMTQPAEGPAEDIAVSSEGEILVSELAAHDFEGDLLEAEAEFLDRLAEGEADALLAENDFDGPGENTPDFGAMLAEAETPVFAMPPFEAREAMEPTPIREPDDLTRAFEALAATPEAPAEAATRPFTAESDDSFLSSVQEALEDLEPAPIVPPPRRSAESYLDEGNVYFNVGQYGLAIERYGQAIDLDDELTAAFYNRANAHTRAGDFELALADYDRALELQPMDADALNNRGMLHLYRQGYAAALGDFNRALEIDPSDTTVMVNRGLAHLHGGNSAAALVDFREASNMDGGDAAAQYGAAQAAASMGNREEALRHVARALELDPGYAREAAADPRLAILAGDDEFLKLLRQSGTRST